MLSNSISSTRLGTAGALAFALCALMVVQASAQITNVTFFQQNLRSSGGTGSGYTIGINSSGAGGEAFRNVFIINLTDARGKIGSFPLIDFSISLYNPAGGYDADPFEGIEFFRVGADPNNPVNLANYLTGGGTAYSDAIGGGLYTGDGVDSGTFPNAGIYTVSLGATALADFTTALAGTDDFFGIGMRVKGDEFPATATNQLIFKNSGVDPNAEVFFSLTTVIPEAHEWAAIALGFMGLVVLVRRKRQAAVTAAA